jgi:hypothetical protein
LRVVHGRDAHATSKLCDYPAQQHEQFTLLPGSGFTEPITVI